MWSCPDTNAPRRGGALLLHSSLSALLPCCEHANHRQSYAPGLTCLLANAPQQNVNPSTYSTVHVTCSRFPNASLANNDPSCALNAPASHTSVKVSCHPAPPTLYTALVPEAAAEV